VFTRFPFIVEDDSLRPIPAFQTPMVLKEIQQLRAEASSHQKVAAEPSAEVLHREIPGGQPRGRTWTQAENR
jgi:hypothetical protein